MLHGTDILFVLSILLVAGVASGGLAKALRLPSVTGQILIGILIGPSTLDILGIDDVHRLKPLIDFALGLMAVSVGSHLVFARLRVAMRRLLILVLLESLLTPTLVFTAVILIPGTPWQLAILLAAIAVSTAPATVLALVKETHSKGMFVKTLVVAVALNNLACICLFELAHATTAASFDPDLNQSTARILMEPVREVLTGLFLGGGIGAILVGVTRRIVRTDRLTALSLMAILLTVGLASHLGASMLLSCLFLGMALANLTPDKEEIGHRVLDNFEYGIFAVFFIVAGMELDFAYVLPGGGLALICFAMRALGKITAAQFSMRLAEATSRVRNWLGPALIPQAGLAVGLMLLVTEDSRFLPIRDLFLAVVLTMVLLNEIIGPLLTRLALKKSGDAGMDRARVIDFLHEENITTTLVGPTKIEAITQLVDLTIKANRLAVDREAILSAVLEREEASSTALGDGLALPHARIDIGKNVIGAMGIHRDGLRLDSPDGHLVHCMVLILTPSAMPERHLEVLSALARVVGSDRGIKHQLYHAVTPAHAYELLHVDEASEDFNFFLEDEDS